MEQPKTYKGYDNDGKVIASYTGADATLKINPDEVQAKIDNVIQVSAEQTGKICSALENVRTDADNALIVEGANMDSYIEMAIEAVTYVKDNIDKIISANDLYSAALSVHDQLQKENNQAAYDATANTSGVVRTQEG